VKENVSGGTIFDALDFSGIRNGSCPFCKLFLTEVGVINAPERDLEIFSLHSRIDHTISGGE